ncbi:unnamed protein product [Ectocarpus sp. 6 AP-2014]
MTRDQVFHRPPLVTAVIKARKQAAKNPEVKMSTFQ